MERKPEPKPHFASELSYAVFPVERLFEVRGQNRGVFDVRARHRLASLLLLAIGRRGAHRRREESSAEFVNHSKT